MSVVLMALWTLAFGQTDAARFAEQGITHLEANRFDAAKAAFEESLKLDPSQYDALSGLGYVHYASGETVATGLVELWLKYRARADRDSKRGKKAK